MGHKHGQLRRWIIWCPTLLILSSAARVRADSFGTNVISAISTNVNGPYTVGDTGSMNYLGMINGGKLTNTIGTIGNGSNANYNTVLVTGGNSAWINTSNLFVGYVGSENSLRIDAGGRVTDSNGYVGWDAASTGNTVTVNGPNSDWQSDFSVILGGSRNLMTVTNGGSVRDVVGVIDGTNNAVKVVGPGSVWTNGNCGVVGWSNQLLITDAGQVNCGRGWVGSDSRSYNLAVVRGSNSVWNIADTLLLGDYDPRVSFSPSSNNLLVVCDGGRLTSRVGLISSNATKVGNVVLVTGEGSSWSNAGTIFVGYSGSDSQLVVTNGGQVSTSNLVVGAVEDFPFIFGKKNAVVVSGGGQLFCTNAVIGFDLIRATNTASVSGLNSQWSIGSTLTNYDSLWITDGGFLNCSGTLSCRGSLTVSDGSRISTRIGFVDDTNVLVTGVGSVWDADDKLAIGSSRTGGLTVEDGGSVRATNLIVGPNAPFSGRLAILGGSLYVTNAAGTAPLDCRRGTITLNGGTIDADRLVMTNFLNSGLTFSGGYIASRGTTASNSLSTFVVGDSTNAAIFHLMGGLHSFLSGLSISSNALLTGCGTITGKVLNNGSVTVDCPAGTLTFTGTVTNNGAIKALNGATVETYGALVNNGAIDIIDGTTNFHSTFVNHGVILDRDGDADGDGLSNLQETLAGTDPLNPSSVLRITTVVVEDDDVRVVWSTAGGKTNAVQAGPAVGGTYSDISPSILILGTGDAATNYLDMGGATNTANRYYRVRLVP
jgi:fibronectin-binding autotransporter adhesin